MPNMTARIGDYFLFETLGEGAFGKVKAAVHEPTGHPYAIKIMEKSSIRHHELTQNVRREIKIMDEFEHRNIVKLHRVLVSTTKLYIVLDLVDGGELFQRMATNGPGGFPENQARKYFQDLIDGVAYCHSRGVCHRDLKPENLLLDKHNNLKITDFGLSSMKGTDTTRDLLTTMCGTPHYVAPEIITRASEGYDGKKVDAWACGIILFALLAGYLPFDEQDISQLFDVIQKGRIAFPRWIGTAPREIIRNLLHVDPEMRFSVVDVMQHPWFRHNYNGTTIPPSPRNGFRKSAAPSRIDTTPDSRQGRKRTNRSRRKQSRAEPTPNPSPPRLAIPGFSGRQSRPRLPRQNTVTIARNAARDSAKELSRQQRGLSFSKNYTLLRRGIVNYSGIAISTRQNGVQSRTLGGEYEARLRGVLSTNTSSSVSLNSTKLGHTSVVSGASDRTEQLENTSDSQVKQPNKCEQQTKTIQAIRSVQTMIAVSKSGHFDSDEATKEDIGASSFTRRLHDVVLAALLRLKSQLSESLEDTTEQFNPLDSPKRKSCASHMSKTQRVEMLRLLDVWETRMTNEKRFPQNQTKSTMVSEEEMFAFQSLLRTWEMQLAGEDFRVEEVLIPGSVVVEEERPTTNVPEGLRPQLPIKLEWHQRKHETTATVALPEQKRTTFSTLSYDLNTVPQQNSINPPSLDLTMGVGELDIKPEIQDLDIGASRFQEPAGAEDLNRRWGNVLIANKSELDPDDISHATDVNPPVLPVQSTGTATIGSAVTEKMDSTPASSHEPMLTTPIGRTGDVPCSPIFSPWKYPISPIDGDGTCTPKAVSENAYSSGNLSYQIGSSRRQSPAQVKVSLSPTGSRPVTPRSEERSAPPRSPARITVPPRHSREYQSREEAIRHGGVPPRSPMRIIAEESSMSDVDSSKAPWDNSPAGHAFNLIPPPIVVRPESRPNGSNRVTQARAGHLADETSGEKMSRRLVDSRVPDRTTVRAVRKSEDYGRPMPVARGGKTGRARTDLGEAKSGADELMENNRETYKNGKSRRVRTDIPDERNAKNVGRRRPKQADVAKVRPQPTSNEQNLNSRAATAAAGEGKNILRRSVDKGGKSRRPSLLRRSMDGEGRSSRALRFIRGDNSRVSHEMTSSRGSSEVMETPKKQRKLLPGSGRQYERAFHSAYKYARCERKICEMLKNQGLKTKSERGGHKLTVTLRDAPEGLGVCLDLSQCDGGCVVQLKRCGKNTRGSRADVAVEEFYKQLVNNFAATEPGVAVRERR